MCFHGSYLAINVMIQGEPSSRLLHHNDVCIFSLLLVNFLKMLYRTELGFPL